MTDKREPLRREDLAVIHTTRLDRVPLDVVARVVDRVRDRHTRTLQRLEVARFGSSI